MSQYIRIQNFANLTVCNFMLYLEEDGTCTVRIQFHSLSLICINAFAVHTAEIIYLNGFMYAFRGPWTKLCIPKKESPLEFSIAFQFLIAIWYVCLLRIHSTGYFEWDRRINCSLKPKYDNWLPFHLRIFSVQMPQKQCDAQNASV